MVAFALKNSQIRRCRNGVLLLLYALSSLPALIFHRHDRIFAEFSAASSCEKAIYYGVQDEHEQHLSESPESCWLCDHHTVSPQVLLPITTLFVQTDFPPEKTAGAEQLISLEPIGFLNKGPPTAVLSILS